MLSPKQWQQNFKNNIAIQRKLGQKYGYKLRNNIYELPKVKQKQRKQKVQINESIKPLQVQQKQLEQSQRLKQLNKQMQQLEVQKKINKMSQNSQSSNMDLNNLINTKIKQYNNLIDHRHLIKKKPKSLFLHANEDKQQINLCQSSDIILEDIRRRQLDLNKTGSLMHKYQRNKQIANLYREYSNSMRLDDQLKAQPKTSPIHRKVAVSGDIKSFVKLREKKGNQMGQLSVRNRYENDGIELDAPYADRKFMESSEQITENLRRNKKIGLMIKQKLENIKLQRQVQQAQQSEILTPHKLPDNKQELNTNISDFSLQYMNISQKISSKQQSSQISQQKSYLSLALQKRSPKYIKQQGSKFVSRYNPDIIAQQMLEGPKIEQKKKTKIELKSNIKKIKIPIQLSQQQKMVMGMMIEDQSDAYYWTTCRNQKVNLMLKGRKHH